MEALHLYYSIKGCQHHRVMNTCMGFRGYSTYLRNDLCELQIKFQVKKNCIRKRKS